MTDHGKVDLPQPADPFTGVISRADDSTPQFPAPPTPPAGAPNVLLILLDDVGTDLAASMRERAVI
jgi:hypothetical protein